MPLPWKKAGISRISRLMADLHPTKPCFSMVVQTGFPTSLVDLFVKNCDRLKKPIKNKNKKKRHHHHHHHHHRHHQSPAVVDFSVSDPVDSSGGSGEEKDHHPVNLNNNFQFKTKVNFDCNKSVGRFESHDENIRGGFDSGCNRDQRGVLYAIFMVFVLVILALISIKILTLGITMSACVLIFVEYTGKQIFQLPVCSNFVRFKAAFWVFLCKEDKREVITESKEEEREDEQEEDDEEEDSIELNSPVEEIEVAEARFDAIARGELDNNGTRMNLSPGRWGYSDIEVEDDDDDDDECEVTAPERQHSRSRRSSREFMKKLVPKKWRAMKKARKGRKEITEEYASSEELFSSHSSEDKLARNEEIEQLYNNSESKGRITFLIEEESKMSIENAVEFEKSYKKEKEVIKKERKKSQRGSAFMLLVALAGLVGGRILALGLTVISCVIIQLVTPRRGQNPKAMC